MLSQNFLPGTHESCSFPEAPLLIRFTSNKGHPKSEDCNFYACKFLLYPGKIFLKVYVIDQTSFLIVTVNLFIWFYSFVLKSNL